VALARRRRAPRLSPALLGEAARLPHPGAGLRRLARDHPRPDDRLSRSLLDFAKIIEAFDRKGVSFVSVTQQFNTTTSMGRLTLNILLSFAQFEREIIGERIRDKVAATKRKGKYCGGLRTKEPHNWSRHH